MVNKKCKLGVRTGNTLRAPRSKHALVYGKESCIIRKSDMEAIPLDSNIHVNNVCLSLDKKGRWQLPEMIKNQIHSTEQAEKEFKLSLFESHKLTKPKNCVSYHTSKGQTKVIQAKKGYFDKRSINDNPSAGNRRNRRRHQQRGDNPEPEQPPPEPIPQVTYEVFYPSPKTSFIAHDFNFIGNTYDYQCDGKANPTANRRANLTTSQYIDMYMEETEFDDWQDELDETEIPPDDTKIDLETQTHNFLESLLDMAIRAKELCDIDKDYVIAPSTKSDRRRRQTNGELSYETKDHVVYLDENFPCEFKKMDNKPKKAKSKSRERSKKLHVKTEVKAEAKQTKYCPETKTMPSARIVIASSELTLGNISEYFPGKCFQGRGFPRRLVIDITEEVTSVFRQREVITRKQEAWSWLIFTYDGEYQDGMQTVRVQVNSELCFQQTRLETLFDMDVYTVSEVYQSLLMFLDSCSSDSIQSVNSVMCATASKPSLTFDTLRSLTGWSHEGYHGSQSHKTTLATISMTVGCDEESFTDIPCAENMLGFCNICFSPIDPTLIDSEPATCLRSCDHWFCDACWREHLLSKTEQGLLKLTCPEFDCDTAVDHVTALSLMPVSKYKLFLQRCHDNHIQLEANKKKWCPNPKCGRILTVVSRASSTKDGEMCVTCDCGLTFCFQCLSEAHWPATCQQAKDHRAKMKSLGDERTSFLSQADDFVVLVKHCPKCRQPINKNGGCPYMMCICGHDFCWACGGSYPHPKCVKRYQSDNDGTVERVLKHEDRLKNRPKFYLMALEHREHRCHQVLKKLERHQRKLISYLQNWSVHHFAGVESILRTYGAVEGDRTSVYLAVEKFVQAQTRLMTEVHFIIENTAVFLQGKGANCQSKLICHLIDRLDFVCSRIKQMLEGGRTQNAKCVIERLQCMQGEVRRCLVFLIPTLASCDTH